MKRMNFDRMRQIMVDTQIKSRGITDIKVLTAINTIPRHLFVPTEFQAKAYDDCPLPIGYNQTISQPYIVALMAETAEIKSTDKVLEVGCGCGYSASILGQLAAKVYTAEIIPELGESTSQRLKNFNFLNIEVLIQDGSAGFQILSPFDVIIVTAGAPSIPTSLKTQLAIGGRMIIPVRYGNSERLIRLRKISDSIYQEENLEDVRFVPLIGIEGWKHLRNNPTFP